MKSEFMLAISQLCAEKGVPRQVVLEAIEAALVSAYKPNFDATGMRVEARVDPETGAARVLLGKIVVADDDADPTHVSLAEAKQLDPNGEVGQTLWVDATPRHFGRIAAQTAKQVVMQKLRDAERKMVLDEFADRQGEILHGIVQRIEQRNVIVELGRVEAVMPPAEQIPIERYYPGQRLKAYVVEVVDTHRGPQVIVSRAHKLMLRRLFEQEVPEVFNGVVELKAIAREAGFRSKVAVSARQEGVDPVGSCVGMRGIRIQNIVNELGGEKVDVVQWSPDPCVYVANALSPAQVLSVEISEEANTATVVVPDKQLSLAIGKEGQNARLAAKLTGWRVDIKSDAFLAAAPKAVSQLAPEELGDQGEISADDGRTMEFAPEPKQPAGEGAGPNNP